MFSGKMLPAVTQYLNKGNEYDILVKLSIWVLCSIAPRPSDNEDF
jgi:hypothetical protein